MNKGFKMSNQTREYVLITDPKVTITLKPVNDGEHSLYVMESGPEWLKTVVWNEDGVVIENKTDRGDIEVVEKNKLRQYEIPVRDVLALMKEGDQASPASGAVDGTCIEAKPGCDVQGGLLMKP